MLATKSTIENFIPQRAPMIMVHDLVEASDERVVTRLAIQPENIFVSEGHFSEPGLVENIAQTAAAQVGYQCSLLNVPVPVGFIAAVKDLAIHALPQAGTTITTEVRIVHKVMDVTVAQGTVEQNGTVLCTCEMKIFVKA